MCTVRLPQRQRRNAARDKREGRADCQGSTGCLALQEGARRVPSAGDEAPRAEDGRGSRPSTRALGRGGHARPHGPGSGGLRRGLGQVRRPRLGGGRVLRPGLRVRRADGLVLALPPGPGPGARPAPGPSAARARPDPARSPGQRLDRVVGVAAPGLAELRAVRPGGLPLAPAAEGVRGRPAARSGAAKIDAAADVSGQPRWTHGGIPAPRVTGTLSAHALLARRRRHSPKFFSELANQNGRGMMHSQPLRCHIADSELLAWVALVHQAHRSTWPTLFPEFAKFMLEPSQVHARARPQAFLCNSRQPSHRRPVGIFSMSLYRCSLVRCRSQGAAV
mmetsp:Transcript_15289/g.44751  ORF Transcript_15289/g.44751 Transcript_15289/m.44751 type:complete len:335 (+) Transcript_15289:490-1494(+)